MRGASSNADRSAEQLRASGRPLVEVISVTVHGALRGAPCGSLRVYDGKRGQIIFSCSPDQAISLISSQTQDDRFLLPLTGPFRAISAEGNVTFEFSLYDGSVQGQAQQDEDDENIVVIIWDAYSPGALYDTPIRQAVNTSYGPVELKYVVFSDAVEGSVEVTLAPRDGAQRGPACVHGSITTHSTSADDAIVLFHSQPGGGDDEAACARSSREEVTLVSLDRSVLAAPVARPLRVELALRSHSGDEIVRGALEFFPVLDEQRHVERLVGRSVDVEVAITWSG